MNVDSENEIPYMKNYGISKSIYAKLRNAIYDALFDLNLEESIYISNESEASSLANTLAVKCCNILDDHNYIKWVVGEKPKSYDTKLDDALKFLEAS